MKNKIPKLFFEKNEEIEFITESIDWDDPTVCVLCRQIDCICSIQKCLCNISANKCIWPNNNCPCSNCLEVLSKCKCTVKIKKEV